MKYLSVAIFSLFIILSVISCKKENLEDDKTYHWKRELFSEAALDPKLNSDHIYGSTKNYLVATDFVYLTPKQVEEEKKLIKRSNSFLYYVFTRIKTP